MLSIAHNDKNSKILGHHTPFCIETTFSLAKKTCCIKTELFSFKSCTIMMNFNFLKLQGEWTKIPTFYVPQS